MSVEQGRGRVGAPGEALSWHVGARGRARAALRSPYFPIWPATALLFLVSPLIAPGSMGTSALSSTVPFAAILAIASVGQTLVIQQRGLDLSVPGMISLATIVITKYPGGLDSGLASAVALVVGASVATGVVNGFAVTRLGVTPLIATLGVNALLLGVILQITGGSSTAVPAPSLVSLAFDKTAGIPNTVIIAAGVVVAVSLFMRHTVIGRRFVIVGTNSPAAYVAGIPVRTYVWGTYVAAALFYSLAAVLLAGYVGTPGLSAGNDYLLPSITAVVLGGASLAGGAGSVVGTALGAVFLIQLQQDVFGAGAPTSVQYLIQAGVIGSAMALRNLRAGSDLRHAVGRLLHRGRLPATGPAT
ncbi:MAG: ABC transporter permease [Actinomycetota bacterium]|nr:ABC transporter permease [Actinomycetota bacterium]